MTTLLEFDTQRLRLRQWQAQDSAPFAALNADPKVMEFFPEPLGRAESDAMAKRCQSLIAARGWGFWAVETKAARDFIGFVGLHVPHDKLPFSPCVEIGWRLGHPYWGKGYATEAALVVLEVGFEQLILPEIVSFAVVANARSRAVMERIGMREEVETFDHPRIPEGHALRQHCLYRLSRAQWLEQSLTTTAQNTNTVSAAPHRV